MVVCDGFIRSAHEANEVIEAQKGHDKFHLCYDCLLILETMKLAAVAWLNDSMGTTLYTIYNNDVDLAISEEIELYINQARDIIGTG